jgi:predicted DNA-binding WGR domain protein
MTTPRIDERVLQLRGGGHHKEYRVWMERAGKGWHVRYAYGRIGMGMREGSKTKEPVHSIEAKSIQDRVWEEKLRKGYRDVFAGEATPVKEGENAAGAHDARPPPAVMLPVNREGRCVIGF